MTQDFDGRLYRKDGGKPRRGRAMLRLSRGLPCYLAYDVTPYRIVDL